MSFARSALRCPGKCAEPNSLYTVEAGLCRLRAERTAIAWLPATGNRSASCLRPNCWRLLESRWAIFNPAGLLILKQ